MAIVVQWQGEDLYALFRYDREAVLRGELWRLVTNGLCHSGWNHLWLNLGTLLVILGLFPRSLNHTTQVGLYLVTFAAVGLGVLLFNPEISGYVGISGALQGLLVVGAVLDFRDGERFIPIAVTVYLVVKLALEQTYGSLPLGASLSRGNVAVDAHLYGAMGGCLWAAISLAEQSRPSPQR